MDDWLAEWFVGLVVYENDLKVNREDIISQSNLHSKVYILHKHICKQQKQFYLTMLRRAQPK